MATGSAIRTLGQAIDAITEALEGMAPEHQLVAIQAACLTLKIENPLAGSRGGTPVTTSSRDPEQNAKPSPGTSDVPRVMDIRSFKEAKSPTSAQDMACVIAFHLQTAPGDAKRETFTVADIEPYFKQAGYPIPSRMSQTLVDAKAAGYLDSAGRGAYKLNPVGYNLVAHGLPRANGVTRASPKSVRKATKKAGKSAVKKRPKAKAKPKKKSTKP